MKNKNFIIGGLVVVMIVVFFTANYLNIYNPQTAEMAHTYNSKFIELSANGNSACFGQNVVFSMDDSMHLTGSCCDKMNQHRYEEQAKGLKKYSHIKEIPSDPYDIPVDLAKKLLSFDSSIILSTEQKRNL